MVALCAAGLARASTFGIGNDWFLEVESFEKPVQDGQFQFNFKIFANDTLNWNHNLKIEPEINAPWFLGFNLVGAFTPPATLLPGDSIMGTMQVLYDLNALPYYDQRLYLQLEDASTLEMETEVEVAVYFTPYNSVEIWNMLDYDKLKRIWDNPAANPPQRIYVNPASIPQSDLNDEEWANDSVPVDYQHVDGLPYMIPIHQQSAQKTNFIFRFVGTASGTLSAFVDPDGGSSPVTIPLTGVTVRLMNFTGTCGAREVGRTETDDTGAWTVDYSSGWRGCTPNMNLFLIIESESRTHNIRIRNRIGQTLRMNSFPATPMTQPDGAANFTNHNFGGLTLTAPVRSRTPLLHWAVRARQLVDMELPGTLPTAWSDRLEIMPALNPAGSGMFMPSEGGDLITDIVTGAIAFSGTLPALFVRFVTRGLVSLFMSRMDALYIGRNAETEGTIFHEFGHYLMWHLQNESWVNLDASFANHSRRRSTGNDRLAFNEGFADGFSAICDAFARGDDGEFGGSLSTSFERRTCNNPAGPGSGNPENNRGTIGGTAGTQAVTHGFGSELSIGAAIFDLWDGPSNFALSGSVPTASSYDDLLSTPTGFEDTVALTLAQIVGPLLRNQGTGGFFGQEPMLIRNITRYFNDIQQSLSDCNRKSSIRSMFVHNGIRNISDAVRSAPFSSFTTEHKPNSDSIYFTTSVSWVGVRNDLSFGPTATINASVDANAFLTASDDFNFTANVDPLLTIRDSLLITGNGLSAATLFFNDSGASGWQNSSNTYGMPMGSIGARPPMTATICGAPGISVIGDGTMELGTSTGNTADVTMESGHFILGNATTAGNLVIHDNSVLTIGPDATLQIGQGANIELLGNNAVLVIQGTLIVDDFAIFTFTGDGEIHFDLPFLGAGPNVAMGTDSKFLMEGSAISDHVFTVADGSYIHPDADLPFEVIIRNGNAEMGENSWINVGPSNFSTFTFTDFLMEAPMGFFNGVRMSGNVHTIENVNMRNAIAAIQALNPAPWKQDLTIANCEFENSITGVRETSNYPGHISLSNFFACDTAISYKNASLLKLDSCQIIGNMSSGQIGVSALNVSTVLVDSVNLWQNDFGMKMENVALNGIRMHSQGNTTGIDAFNASLTISYSEFLNSTLGIKEYGSSLGDFYEINFQTCDTSLLGRNTSAILVNQCNLSGAATSGDVGIYATDIPQLVVDSSEVFNMDYGLLLDTDTLIATDLTCTNNTSGIEAVSCNLTATSSDFSNNGEGVYAYTPTAEIVFTECSASNNSGHGFFFELTAHVVTMVECIANNNDVGLRVANGTSLLPSCGSYSNNATYGMFLENGTWLDMDSYSYVEVVNNGVSNVNLDLTPIPMLNYGNNDLTRASGGKSLTGMLIGIPCNCTWYWDGTKMVCGAPYTMIPDYFDAYENSWVSPLTSPGPAEIDLVSAPSGNCSYSVNDGSTGALWSCSSPAPRHGSPNHGYEPFADTGRELNSGPFKGMAMGTAFNKAISTENDEEAIRLLNSIVTSAPISPQLEEVQILGQIGAHLASRLGRSKGRNADVLAASIRKKGLGAEVLATLQQIERKLSHKEYPYANVSLRLAQAHILIQAQMLEEAIAKLDVWMASETGEVESQYLPTRCHAAARLHYLSGKISFAEFLEQRNACESQKTPASSAEGFEPETEELISVYPNPTNGIVNFEWEGLETGWEITVFDLQGQVQQNFSGHTDGVNGFQKVSIPMGQLPSGLYLLQLNREGTSFTTKVLVQ